MPKNHYSGDWIEEPTEITLRDHFAMAALNSRMSGWSSTITLEEIAEDAYRMADAMLQAREKKP